MPGGGGRRQRTDHAGGGFGAGKTPGWDLPDPGHPLQFRRRRGQLFRMGAGLAAIVLGRGRSDAARISHPRPRLRPDGGAGEGRQDPASHRRDGDRGGEGPRRQDHAGAFPVITGLDHVVVLVSDIAAAVAAYETLFARAPAWRNIADAAPPRFFPLANMTLELIAPGG